MHVSLTMTFCLIALAGGAIRLSHPAAAQSLCNPIGRIVSGSGKNFAPGRIICAGDHLVGANKAQMLCFNNRLIIQFQTTQTAVVDRQTCSGGPLVATEPCQQGQATQCFRSKGQGQGDFQFIEPSQTTVIEDRPRIAWEPVPGATQYTVRVSGLGVSWQRSVNGTALDYPLQESALQGGNAYRIVVVARLPTHSLTSFTVVNRVMPEQTATRKQGL